MKKQLLRKPCCQSWEPWGLYRDSSCPSLQLHSAGLTVSRADRIFFLTYYSSGTSLPACTKPEVPLWANLLSRIEPPCEAPETDRSDCREKNVGCLALLSLCHPQHQCQPQWWPVLVLLLVSWQVWNFLLQRKPLLAVNTKGWWSHRENPKRASGTGSSLPKWVCDRAVSTAGTQISKFLDAS